MSTAKKPEQFPEETYLANGIREGWITIQDVGHKWIVVDPDHFQARVRQPDGKHFDILHVKRLAAIRDTNDGQPLHPIVTFYDPKAGKYVIADGFHRTKESQNRREVSIRAYVVKVDDWEHQATLYAAMCNQQALLARTPEDIRKAVELLFADPECWVWSNGRIGKYCGVSGQTVGKYRIEYARAHGMEQPSEVIRSDGRPLPYGYRPDYIPKESRRSGNRKGSQIHKMIGGKIFSLGPNRESAEEKLTNAHESISQKKRSLDTGNLSRFFASRNVDVQSVTVNMSRGVSGWISGRTIFVVVDFANRQDVSLAVGNLVLIREYASRPDALMAVVCYREDGPAELINLAMKVGVEFLTPDELVASLKPTEGNQC